MKPWRINWRGQEWTDDDLTAGDLSAVQLVLGTEQGWAACDVWAGPLQLSAMIAALWVRTMSGGTAEGATEALAEVIAQIASSPAAELLNAISERS